MTGPAAPDPAPDPLREDVVLVEATVAGSVVEAALGYVAAAALVVLTTHGVLRVALLVAGAGLAVAAVRLGPSRRVRYLTGDALVAEDGRRRVRVPLAAVRRLGVGWVPYGPSVLSVESDDARVEIRLVDEADELLLELGRRLHAAQPGRMFDVGAMRVLGMLGHWDAPRGRRDDGGPGPGQSASR